REPLGVVAGIIPWNSPLALAALKISAAIASGNTIVLKPSVSAPLAALELARICDRHLPPGVVNVVTGSASECGTPLAQHPMIRKISFTGSTEAGRALMRVAADRIVPATMELGGKNPQIVFPDSDAEDVVEGVFLGVRFTRQGQSCTSGARLYLHESIFDSFLDKLVKRLNKVVVGDPLDEATDMGAIINRSQFDKVCGYIQDGLNQEGARLLTGGLPPSEGPLAKGYFVEPTVFGNVRHEWRIAKEEIFGPVLAAIPWNDEQEVIRMANDSLYGLAGFIWTRDIGKGLRMAHAIEAGFMQVNQAVGPMVSHSYGGYKMSGIGREWSLEGMLESFTQRKVVIVNLKK
ncbi:MAG: aldehyde dehydrogenase family protein, partial [Dehalococcoidia bacterium]|nr:aldehyde dehydrogenase family protein [Dehalococcoidia bacterium]